MPAVTIRFAEEELTLALPDGVLRHPRGGLPAEPLADVRTAATEALNEPLEFPPLYRALTPDDRVAIVVREELACVAALLDAVMDHLERAGISPSAVTLVVPPRAYRHLPDWRGKHCQLKLEVHEPGNASRLAYLASTKAGRRVYLNRTVVDADQVVIIGRAGFDPLFGYSGGLADLFPLLSDQATRHEFFQRPSQMKTGQPQGLAEAETEEVGWLLGLPLFVQALETSQDRLSHVVAGTAAPVRAQTCALLNRHARYSALNADLVIATLTGAGQRQTLGDVAAALETASRVVRPGGRIVVLSRAQPELSAGFEMLRNARTPERGLSQARQADAPDAVSLWQWLCALQHAKVTLLSGLAAEVAEELFVTPMDHPGQLARLAEGAESVLVIPDAHRCLVQLT